MTIDIKSLKVSDIGRKVVYTDWGDKKDLGTLTSWNTNSVFVKFTTGDTSESCEPKYLSFV